MRHGFEKHFFIALFVAEGPVMFCLTMCFWPVALKRLGYCILELQLEYTDPKIHCSHTSLEEIHVCGPMNAAFLTSSTGIF
ncbi:hypothetical protein FKM82_023141 [Ascaphus truei]